MAQSTYEQLRSQVDALNSLVNLQEEKAIIIEVTGFSTYVGKAHPGAATADGVWKINRIIVVGGTTIITWADGNTNSDNIWDNRASLTYL